MYPFVCFKNCTVLFVPFIRDPRILRSRSVIRNVAIRLSIKRADKGIMSVDILTSYESDHCVKQ